jgi:hypothetical protein
MDGQALEYRLAIEREVVHTVSITFGFPIGGPNAHDVFTRHYGVLVKIIRLDIGVSHVSLIFPWLVVMIRSTTFMTPGHVIWIWGLERRVMTFRRGIISWHISQP